MLVCTRNNCSALHVQQKIHIEILRFSWDNIQARQVFLVGDRSLYSTPGHRQTGSPPHTHYLKFFSKLAFTVLRLSLNSDMTRNILCIRGQGIINLHQIQSSCMEARLGQPTKPSAFGQMDIIYYIICHYDQL